MGVGMGVGWQVYSKLLLQRGFVVSIFLKHTPCIRRSFIAVVSDVPFICWLIRKAV